MQGVLQRSLQIHHVPIPIHEDESEEEGVWDVLGDFVGYTVATLYTVADTVTSHNTATSLNTLDGCIGLSSDFTQ